MAEELKNIDQIFWDALQIESVPEREAFLQRSCGDDEKLRRTVQKLINAQPRAERFLEEPFRLGVTAEMSGITERPGTVIGAYKLLQQVGEGGMGVVFMAEQTEPIQRTVALKIIKPGMDTRQVIARFEAERQAVAMMDHPNIAKVLDAGTTDSGRPYFVMELVKGVPITKYCDEKHLPLPARLELFVQVCQAVQHAHQKGIIHRDIKPNNVLVAEYDNRAVPKVIDFGVAKATAQKLTERTMFTEFGQVLGTMEYMSPEQSKFNQLDIDTRSDIYSLGVLLYELLAGSTPFEGKRLHAAAFDEMLRIIREEEPPKPSTRLSSIDTLPSVAVNRQTEPARLSREVSGELDWIVMKCLEKDRNRRYETANVLAADLHRYLADEPVVARPTTRTYRLKKFIRRHKVGVAAGSAVVLALIAGLALATTGFVQARRQARIAVAEADKATAISDLLQEALESANPDKVRGTDYTVRQLLDEISAGIKEQFKDKPEVEAALHATIGNAYRRLNRLAKAGPHLEAALDLRRRVFGSVSPEVADSLADYAWYLKELDELQRADAAAQEAVAIHRKLRLPDDQAVKVLEASAILPDKYGELEQIVEEIRSIASRHPDRYPQLATVLHWLAGGTNDLAKAERLAREAVELHRKLHGGNHPETAYGISTLAVVLKDQHKLDEAEACYREALAIFRRNYDDDQTPIVQTLFNLAIIANAKGDQAALDELRAKAVEIASVDSEDFETWQYRGALHTQLGQAKLAIAAYSRAIQLNESIVHSWILRGQSYQELGEFPLAEEDFSKAIELEPNRWSVWRARGVFYAQRKQADKARADIAMAVKLCPTDATNLNALAWSLANTVEGQPQFAQTAVELAKKGLAAAPDDNNLWNTLGVAQYRAGAWKPAIDALEKSMKLRDADDAFDWFFLAMARWRLDQKDKARQWYDKAVEWTDKNQPNNEELRRFRTEAEELLKITDQKPTTKPPVEVK